MSSPTYTLYHGSGMGSTFTLALLHLFDVPHIVKEIKLDFRPAGIAFNDDQSRTYYAEMKNLNPLAQFPTLVKHEGNDKVALSETAAIALYLHDKHAKGTPWSTASLTDAQLAMFYRLMVFIPANIYALFSIEDFPKRYITVPPSSAIPTEEAVSWVEAKTGENIKAAFITLNQLLNSFANSESPFALGTPNPTILDVYISLVAHYGPRPRYTWLEENCPRVYACARETLKHPILKKVFLSQDFEARLTEA